jgi:hypothetical protein
MARLGRKPQSPAEPTPAERTAPPVDPLRQRALQEYSLRLSAAAQLGHWVPLFATPLVPGGSLVELQALAVFLNRDLVADLAEARRAAA